VRTNNPRSLSAEETAEKMREAGIAAEPCGSLEEALTKSRKGTDPDVPTLVCGSLFLAGEALVALGAYPWGDASRIDPSEALRPL
jgi:dihydrofolate synthase/folylpolyglutamate synthase